MTSPTRLTKSGRVHLKALRAHNRKLLPEATGPFSFRIEVTPESLINKNHRMTWKLRNSRTQSLRALAQLTARSKGMPKFDRARVKFIYSKPAKGMIWRDVGNLQPTSAALLDGLIDAGMLPDDSDEYLEGPENHTSPTRMAHLFRVGIDIHIEPLPPTH